VRRALVVLALVSWIATASADQHTDATKPTAGGDDSNDVIGLLDVRVEGVSAAAGEVFIKQIEESLEISGLKVAPRKRLHEYLAGTPWNSACLMGDCLRELRLRAAVHRVIEVALVTNGPSYHYVVTLLDTESGKTVSQLARKCDVCTTEEAFAAAALAVVELVNGVGDASPTDLKAAPDQRSSGVARARSRARTLGLVLVGVAVAAGAGSYYLYSQDRDGYGAGAAGAAGALGVAGVTAIGVSFTF